MFLSVCCYSFHPLKKHSIATQKNVTLFSQNIVRNSCDSLFFFFLKYFARVRGSEYYAIDLCLMHCCNPILRKIILNKQRNKASISFVTTVKSRGDLLFLGMGKVNSTVPLTVLSQSSFPVCPS